MAGPEFATLTTDDLVTGEAVALDLPPAGLGTRMVSGLIDVVATLVLLVAVVMVFMTASLQADEALLWVAWIGTLVTVFLVFPTSMETLTRGKSLGKLAMGLRTVRDDAGPVSFQQSFVRALLAVVEVYLFAGVPAFFCALLNSRGKRLGDLAAGTYVVRERVRLRLPPPPPMPPQLATWATYGDTCSARRTPIRTRESGSIVGNRPRYWRTASTSPAGSEAMSADRAQVASRGGIGGGGASRSRTRSRTT